MKTMSILVSVGNGCQYQQVFVPSVHGLAHRHGHRHPRGATAEAIALRLRAAGLSPTPRRRQVLEALGDRWRPVGAHELYVELVTHGYRIGMSTVYRTLSALAESELLHVFIHDGQTRYRPCAPDRHYHLVCRRCGTSKSTRHR
jgi:Fe2+ or Zn2+ uptake regulation protein